MPPSRAVVADAVSICMRGPTSWARYWCKTGVYHSTALKAIPVEDPNTLSWMCDDEPDEDLPLTGLRTVCFLDFLFWIDDGTYDCMSSRLPHECIFWKSLLSYLAFDTLTWSARSQPGGCSHSSYLEPGGTAWRVFARAALLPASPIAGAGAVDCRHLPAPVQEKTRG